MAVGNEVFIQFCGCMDKLAEAEKRNDLKSMRFYLKKAESYPLVVNFQKWLLEYSKNIFLFLHEDRADKDAAVRELLRLRKEALYKPQTLEEFEKSCYRYVKQEYVWLMLHLVMKYSDKTYALQEYEELCHELIEIMEKEQWKLLGEEVDYYSCIYGMTADYYASTGRPALADRYYKKIWDKYKDGECIPNICFTVLCFYVKNLTIQGRSEEAVEVISFLCDRLFDEKSAVYDDGTEIERMIQRFFYQMAGFMEHAEDPKLALKVLDAVLETRTLKGRKWNEYTLEIYHLYLNELNDKNLNCSLKRKLEIQHYLYQYQKRINLDEKPAWKSLQYYTARYISYKLKKSSRAAVYLDKCRQILQEGKFEELDRMTFLAGVQFVTKEYIEFGDNNKACECAEYFMKKNVEFYAAAEFYIDNESMEKYLEICDLYFQYLYQAVSGFVSNSRKFEYSLNYKKILSSAIRLRNNINAADENELVRREKKPDALQYFTVQMLEEMLPDHTAVLDFLYLEPEIYETRKRTRILNHPRAYKLDIFVTVKIDGRCMADYKSIQEAEGLNELVEELISKMKTGVGKMKKLSVDVYHELILEFEPVLKDVEHLWICSDGVLCNLSFDTLFELANSALNIRDFTYWQSIRDIFEVWQAGTDDSKVRSCMIGNPKFELKDIGNMISDNESKRWDIAQLIPLPYSGYEAQKLSMVMDGECFVGKKATKFVLKHGYRYIHIATHGFNQCESENAWYNSMLAFSGSQDYLKSGRDTEGYGNGFLSAEEISKMNLRGTELVVLSACGSGNSIFSVRKQQTGLHVAFGTAGVKYIISALWEVDDFPTAVLMNIFYENLKKDMPAAEALFQAKIQLKNMTVEKLIALIQQDKELLICSCDELLAEFERLPPQYCYYSSMRYWGSFTCNRAMY